MRFRLAVSVVLAFLSAVPAMAQYSRADVFTGYSFLRFDSSSLGVPKTANLNGWDAAGAVYFKSWLSAVGDFSGNYGKHDGFAFNAYNFLAGPQLIFRRHGSALFIRGLVGSARNTISGSSDSGLEYGAGGGLDIGLTSHLAARAFQADYLKTHTFGVDQTNVRIAAGLVWRIGGK
jgi:hypothetical protein